jgi:hypothetical protein
MNNTPRQLLLGWSGSGSDGRDMKREWKRELHRYEVFAWKSEEKTTLGRSGIKVKVKLRPWRPIGLWDDKAHTIGSQMAVRLSTLHAGRPLPPRKFQVLISVRDWVKPRAIVRLEGLSQLKKIHLTGTRNRDLPACCIVPVRIVLKSFLKKSGRPDWIHLAQNRDEWRALESP